MKIEQVTYQLTNFRNLKNKGFSFLFFLFLVASPIVQLTNIVEDISYEMVDVSEKEENSKQDSVSEIENETNIFPNFNDFYFQFENRKQPSFFTIQLNFMSFKKEIKLPPPRVV